jgi:hypothetical protein
VHIRKRPSYFWVISVLAIALPGSLLFADSSGTIKIISDSKYGFKFQYPDTFDIMEPRDIADATYFQNHLETGGLALAAAVYPSELDYPKSTLVDAFVTISVGPPDTTAESCRYYTGGNLLESTTTFNGIKYSTLEVGSINAGTLYTQRIYHTYRNARCYELTPTVATMDIAEEDVPPVSKEEVFKTLEVVLASFTFQK